MIALRRLAQRLFWPSVIGTVVVVAGAAILLVAGAELAAAILASVVGVVAIPLLAFGYASPRAGLLWQGSYAEPWRSERSPGEWSVIEADRYDRDLRKSERS